MPSNKEIDTWLRKDYIEDVEITPAATLYTTDFNMAIWTVRDLFWRFRDLMYQGKNNELRIQSWQYVKAYAKILKAKNQWDHEAGIPIEHGWTNLQPETSQWISYYMRHPEDQALMQAYRKWYERKYRKGANDAAG